MTSGDPWYVTAFGRDYLTVYAHRDAAAAAEEAAVARALLAVDRGDPLLDLACGAGRHCRAFAAAGLRVTGLDRSFDLLGAAAREGGGPRYVLGDMRRLPFPRRFRAVTMFFTSFGYFETDAENFLVLREAARVLLPGGRLLIDYVNRDVVIDGLVPESRDEVDGARIEARRRLSADGRRVEKEVLMTRPDGTGTRYEESVRLFEPPEVEEALHGAGFAVETRKGSLAGEPFTAESARLVLVGRLPC